MKNPVLTIWLSLLAALMSLSGPTGAYADKKNETLARLITVDSTDPAKAQLLVEVIDGQGPGSGPSQVTWWLSAKVKPEGWPTSPPTLVAGDIVRVITEEKDKALWIKSIKLALPAAEVDFPGRDKLKDSTVQALFSPKPPQARIIITLATKTNEHEPGRAEIKRLQNKVLKSLPPGEFKLIHRLENLPVFSGEATYIGLKALAAHPLVESITEDIEMEMKTQDK